VSLPSPLQVPSNPAKQTKTGSPKTSILRQSLKKEFQTTRTFFFRGRWPRGTTCK
jgi:hypothetical protein